MLFVGGSFLWRNGTCYRLFDNYVFCGVCVNVCSLLMIAGNVFVCHAPPTFTAVTSPEKTSFCFPHRTHIQSFYVRRKFFAFGYGEHCLFRCAAVWIGRNVNVSDKPITSLFRVSTLLITDAMKFKRQTAHCSLPPAAIKVSTVLSLPVPVAARSKAYVFGRSPVEIVSSNPTEGMDVCLL
jgi:hypothetical protein